MKYLFIKEDGELEQGNEISDEERENVDDGIFSVLRFNNGTFESLKVEKNEDDEGDTEWGEDQWNAV